MKNLLPKIFFWNVSVRGICFSLTLPTIGVLSGCVSTAEAGKKSSLAQIEDDGNGPHLFREIWEHVEQLLQEFLLHTEEAHTGAILAERVAE